MDAILWGTLGSLAAGLMTGTGALPVLFGHRVPARRADLMLGFAAGVRLSASFFSLILPAIETVEARGGTALVAALLTGLVEPLGGLAGAAAVHFAAPLLPWALAFAAGAMLYVISHEILPETHRRGHQGAATTGLTFGLVLMLVPDVALG